MAVSPDGSVFATVGMEGVVRVWDSATRQRVLSMPGHQGVTMFARFTADVTHLVTTGSVEDKQARFWAASRAGSTPQAGRSAWKYAVET